MKGIITKYVTPKGYGFIKCENGKTYFFHVNDTNLNPNIWYKLDGIEVEFDVVERHESVVIKQHAENIQILADMTCPEEAIIFSADPDTEKGS